MSKEWKNGSEGFWDSIIVVALGVKEKKDTLSNEFLEEVKEMFENKNYEEMTEMESEIKKTLASPETLGVMDFEYWENVVKIL